MQRDINSKGAGRPIALILAATCLAACGSQSTAAANDAQANTATNAATSVAAATPAAAPTALPPAALSAWERFARGRCRDQGERFAAVRFAPLTGRTEAVDLVEQHFASRKGGFVLADFNADGSPDFIVTTPGHGCVTSNPAYGDQGPPVDFIVSSASGYRVFNGFMGWISPAMIARRGDRDLLDLPGSFNGRCGTVAKVTWGWTGTDIDAVERRNDRGQLVDREGCAQAPAARQPQVAATSSPIEKGFYAFAAGNGSCADAIEQQFFAYWDGTHIEALGGNRYRIRFREVEAAEVILNDRIFAVNSRTSLTEQYGARWTHCPTAQIPPSVLQYVRLELGLK